MAQEPRDDVMGVTPGPWPWPSDPMNTSALPGAANATAEATPRAEGGQSSFAFRDTLLLVSALISLCGLVGNGTVLWLLGFRMKRSPFSVYILNLAGVDFTFLLCQGVTVPLFLTNHYSNAYFTAIRVLKFMLYLMGLSLLMAISTERCLATLFPIWYKCHRPAHLSTIVCALIWGLSLCLGVWFLLCMFALDFFCNNVNLIRSVMLLITFLVLAVSSLTLLIRVQCCSQRRQTSKFYKVILLTVLAFLLFRLFPGAGFTVSWLSPSDLHREILIPIFFFLSVLNSTFNPFIYFFVGRQGHQPGRKPLRDVLRSAFTDDVQLSTAEPLSSDSRVSC